MGKWSGFVMLALVVILGAIYWMPAQAKEERPVAAKLLRALEESGAAGETIQVRARTAMGLVESPDEVKRLAEHWAEQLEIPFSHVEISRKHQMIVYQSETQKEGVQLRYEV